MKAEGLMNGLLVHDTYKELTRIQGGLETMVKAKNFSHSFMVRHFM